MSTTMTTARVRALNDELRCYGRGGQLTVTAGVAALPAAVQQAAMTALQQFDGFDIHNDPYEEHDFGALAVGDTRLLFKLDYYDRSGRVHSPDPADPAVTCRVLTLMLADEY